MNFDIEELGGIRKIRIEHDNPHTATGWGLDKVEWVAWIKIYIYRELTNNFSMCILKIPCMLRQWWYWITIDQVFIFVSSWFCMTWRQMRNTSSTSINSCHSPERTETSRWKFPRKTVTATSGQVSITTSYPIGWCGVWYCVQFKMFPLVWCLRFHMLSLLHAYFCLV